ncbi:glycerophosphodiester phosphodiesterase [Pseudozobellia thermophila]|uniref:Glycerophosphoryl diester phosphodiesterase n=1 Tax=Pseudozobellia thermophila TaxID=192903 RepID=A0A1M6I332_9FLAO|nr:glycerophosphodiester phosphodiesterase family protein [Pseudozobellia thermophila]SHJ28856.1 glycerophosphoryl diester phosphodiesterase [Pseudozobellia thermophila]
MKRTRFLILVLAVSISHGLSAQSAPENTLPQQGICAHRGAHEKHPENTMAAFREAIRLGAQMIEFDVRLSKDGHPVVIHDPSVDRTTNGSGAVKSLTLAELKTLDAGSWKSPEFSDEKIPTLQEVLAIMPKDIWLNIHLKGGKKLGKITAQLILLGNRGHQAVLACEKKAALGVQKVDPSLKICNMERTPKRSSYIEETLKRRYAFIQLKKSRDDQASPSDIKRLKEHGVLINYVAAETPEEMRLLFDKGIDFVLTDNLYRLIKAFDHDKGKNRK